MRYDLEKRTFDFSSRVRDYVRSSPKDLPSIEYLKQLVRSSASIGANYVEANESWSRKDYFMRV